MVRLPAGFVRFLVRFVLRPFLGPPFPVGFQRFWSGLASKVNPPCRGASRETVEVAGMSTARVWPKSGEPTRTLLYFHGGGYCVGGWETHIGLITHLAVAADATVYSPNYSLAPEHPHPAALDDAVRAYRWLLDRGTAPASIALAGDSAGGGLALATAIEARDQGLPAPASIVLLSPWVDLRGDTPSLTTNARLDPMLRPSWSRACAASYLHGRDPNDPKCSPLFADHRGLPPMLIHVGTDEIIIDDATRLAERCRAADVDVTLRIFDDMWHDFQIHVGAMRESDEAVAEIGEFLQARVAGPATPA